MALMPFCPCPHSRTMVTRLGHIVHVVIRDEYNYVDLCGIEDALCVPLELSVGQNHQRIFG